MAQRIVSGGDHTTLLPRPGASINGWITKLLDGEGQLMVLAWLKFTTELEILGKITASDYGATTDQNGS